MTEVGKIVSDKINSALDSIDERIKWDNVGKKLGNGAKALASGFRSILTELHFEDVGKTVSDGLNTIIYTVEAFEAEMQRPLAEINNTILNGYGMIGADLADVLYGAIDGIDWTALNNHFLNKIINVFDIVKGFVARMTEQIPDAEGKIKPRFIVMVDNMFTELAQSIRNKSDISEIGNILGDFLILAFDFGATVFGESEFWNELAEVVSQTVKKLTTKLQDPKLKGAITNFVTNGLQVAVQLLEAADIAGLINAVTDVLKDVFNDPKIMNLMSRLWSQLGEIAGSWFKAKIWGWFTRLWYDIIGFVNGVAAFFGKNSSVVQYHSNTQPHAFANGGVIPDNSIVSVSSGELLGKLNNGKTVAANNQMIQSVLYAGVRDAVSDGMNDAGGGGNGRQIVVTMNIDSRAFSEAMCEPMANAMNRKGVKLRTV